MVRTNRRNCVNLFLSKFSKKLIGEPVELAEMLVLSIHRKVERTHSGALTWTTSHPTNLAEAERE